MPTVVKGRQCYTINVDKIKNRPKFGKGRLEGLVLLIDFNDEMSSGNEKDLEREIGMDFINALSVRPGLLMDEKSKPDVEILIKTLEPTLMFGSGQYILSAVKQMETSEDFDKLTLAQKKCVDKETFDSCSLNTLDQEAQEYCGCVPFKLLSGSLKV